MKALLRCFLQKRKQEWGMRRVISVLKTGPASTPVLGMELTYTVTACMQLLCWHSLQLRTPSLSLIQLLWMLNKELQKGIKTCFFFLFQIFTSSNHNNYIVIMKYVFCASYFISTKLCNNKILVYLSQMIIYIEFLL